MIDKNAILNVFNETKTDMLKNQRIDPIEPSGPLVDKLKSVTFNELVLEATNIVTFTGAGISTESGIPDFRSNNGIYQSGEFQGYNPQDILSRKTFRENPKLFYSFYKHRLTGIIHKQPNKAHLALVELEKMGKIKWVVTQNIDNLHQKAGSVNVLDLHGNGSKAHCISCSRKYTYEQFDDMLNSSDIARCDCGGKVRPTTVLFDESLNDETYDTAYRVINEADLLIVIGSSLSVQPAAGLVNRRNKNCTFVIINNTETVYDGAAQMVIRESCGDVMDRALVFCESYKKL